MRKTHRGDGNFARSLQHVHPVVDRSVRSCASVSRGKRVSNVPIGARHFPIGAMGTFEGLCGTYILKLTEALVAIDAAIVQARVEASPSAGRPMRAMRNFEHMSTHIDVASSDVEPDQLHDARRPWVDVQHTTRI